MCVCVCVCVCCRVRFLKAIKKNIITSVKVKRSPGRVLSWIRTHTSPNTHTQEHTFRATTNKITHGGGLRGIIGVPNWPHRAFPASGCLWYCGRRLVRHLYKVPLMFHPVVDAGLYVTRWCYSPSSERRSTITRVLCWRPIDMACLWYRAKLKSHL